MRRAAGVLRGHVFTLRFKLTLVFVLVSAVMVTTLCAFVLTMGEKNLLTVIDERLIERAQTAVDALEAEAQREAESRRGALGRFKLKRFEFSKYYFLLRDSEGVVVDRTSNLQKGALPFTEAAARTRQSHRPVLETDSGDVAAALLGPGRAFRVLTLYYATPSVRPGYLQVAISLAPVGDAIDELRRLFYLVIPIGLLAAGAASWWLARRSLAPIGKIARDAREFTAARLDRRIDPPPGKDEVAAMVATINQMLDRLEAAFRAHERFTADAAHELKTPVAVLLGESQVMTQKNRTDDEYRRFVLSVQDEMRGMARTVDSMLTLARADAGVPPGAMEPVSVNELVTDAVQAVEPLARRRHVRVVPRLAVPATDRPEPQVTGDAELLRAMVSNLVRNAVAYSPENETVEIEVAFNDRLTAVAVRDRGPGIPPDQRDRVFERFYRVPRMDGQVPGTGLGLAIARGVAKLHQGAIAVTNRPKGGCEFVVRLPVVNGSHK